MADILFKCPACGKALAVDDRHKGMPVKCVDCRADLTVPVPRTWFRCPACRCLLGSTEEHHGQSFTCSQCGEPLVVAPPGTPPAATAPPPAKEPAEPALPGKKGLGDGEYDRMLSQTLKRSSQLKVKKKNPVRRFLVNALVFLALGAILYGVLSFFIDDKTVKIIVWGTIAVVIGGALIRYLVTSSIYD